MRAVVPTVLTLAGLALAACTAPTGTNSAPSSPPATPSASASPSSSAVAFTFPKRTKDELARSEYRNGTVSNQAWHKVTKTGIYDVRMACASDSELFGYQIRVNGVLTSAGEFTCGLAQEDTVGKASAGDRIEVRLTKIVAPIEAWAIVVPEQDA